MLTVFLDGIKVLAERGGATLSIFGVVLICAILMAHALRKWFNDQLTLADAISLGMAAWIFPLALFSVIWFTLDFFLGRNAATLLSILGLIALFFPFLRWKFSLNSFWVVLAFSLTWMMFLILQFAFLKSISLPSYFDSAEHYRIIRFFVETNTPLSLVGYYHVGFHFISAVFVRAFQLNIIETMLVFGQVILATLPFSMFFVVRQITGSTTAAAFTCLLAGIGWHMPAHSMNWGKYPALLSLIGIQFVFGMGYLMYKKTQPKKITYGLAIFALVVTTLIHTRSLILFIMMGIALLLTNGYKHSSNILQRISFLLVLSALVIETLFILKNPVLSLLFGTYFEEDLLVTGLSLFLFACAIYAFPKISFFLLALVSLMMAGVFIPINNLPGYGALTLLDRPYVQMLFYIPLSVAAGLGLAGLLPFLYRFQGAPQMVSLAVFVFIVWAAAINHKFYPSDCCQIASHDDLAAIHWMDTALLPDAEIMIASTDLLVTSLEESTTLAGVDGGIWVRPLIGRSTMFMRWNSNLSLYQSHLEMCKRSAEYIYVGSKQYSFNAAQLDAQPQWYQLVFALPTVRVYQVSGCE